MRLVYLLPGILVAASTLSGQTWPDKNTATPDLVQTGFGPNGSALPFDGGEYCGPTTVSMVLGYLNNAGFTQLLGENPGESEYLNLVRVMTGLGVASDSGGTDVSTLIPGIGVYMSAKGISPTNRFLADPNGGYHTSIPDIASENVNQDMLFGVLGWYYETNGVYYRGGGHFFAITDQQVGSPGTLTIHNPFPNALLDVPNIPSEVQQSIPMADFQATPTNTVYYYDNNNPVPLPTGTYLQFAANQQNTGPSLGTQAIVEQVFRISIDASQLPNTFVPQDWEIHATQNLATGGGNLDVTTRVTGTGGFNKLQDGDLIFHKEVTLTGNHNVSAGAMVARQTSGDVFGTGSIELSGTGGLVIRPDDSNPTNVSVAVASRADTVSENGATFGFSGANSLELHRGNNTSLTVTLGGNAGNGVSNFVQTGPAPTLVIHANDLGSTEKVVVTGSGANLPGVVNGIVGPNVVGSQGTNRTGSFLTYDSQSGFVGATMTGGDINSAGSTTLYETTTPQTLTAGAAVYALEVGATTVGGAFELAVGPGTGKAGVILNGGSIETESLNFGSAQAQVYTSLDDGTIAAELVGSGGLVKFGQGTLELTTTSDQFTGTVHVQEGTLEVSAAQALGGSGNAVSVSSHAAVQVNSGGSIAGTVSATANSTILLQGGSLGNVNLQSTTNSTGPIQGATLQGSGSVENVDLNGYIAADPTTGAGMLTINGLVTPGDAAAFIWSLDTLVDDFSGGLAGSDWNAITLTNAEATFGTYGNDAAPVNFLFDFGDGLDPNSGNAFWNSNHQWTFLTYSGRSSSQGRTNLAFPTTAFPAGTFSYTHDGNQTLLLFTAIPEPAAAALVLASLTVLLGCGRRNRAGYLP